MAEQIMQKPKEKSDYQGSYHHLQKKLMDDWMEELNQAAANNEPTAYMLVAGSNMSCMLRCLGIHQVYPELTALQLGIRRKSLPFLLAAEEMGYSTDVCGYVKVDIANLLAGNKSAYGTQLPKPS